MCLLRGIYEKVCGVDEEMNLKVWLRSVFKKKGIRIGFGTKKAFDPHYQKRTDPIKEMVERDNQKENDNAN